MSAQSQLFCQQICNNSKSSFTQSFMILPSDQKRAMTALYAFCRLVDDLADELSKIDYSKALQELQFYSELIENLYSQKTQIYSHSNHNFLAEELTFAIENFGLDKTYFVDLLKAMNFDLLINSKQQQNIIFDDFSQLENYCYQVAATVGLLSSAIFGYQKNNENEIENIKKYAHDLGLALQFTNIMRDVREDFFNQRIYLVINAKNSDNSDFELPKNFDEISWKNFENFIISQNILENHAKIAEQYFQTAFAYFKKLSPQTQNLQKPALIMAAVYRQVLKEIVKKKYNIFQNQKDQHFRLSSTQKFLIVSQMLISSDFVLNDQTIF